MSHGIDIACLFIKRKFNMDAPPELVAAWDGWSIEENFEGWQQACKTALESIGDDIGAFRYVNVKIPGDDVEELFREYVTVEAVAVSEMDAPSAL